MSNILYKEYMKIVNIIKQSVTNLTEMTWYVIWCYDRMKDLYKHIPQWAQGTVGRYNYGPESQIILEARIKFRNLNQPHNNNNNNKRTTII